MLFFKHDSKRLCVDATEDDGSYGRLINHSKTERNVKMRVVIEDNNPKVVFFAERDIEEGEELSYDYGENRKDVVAANPWLRS